MSYRLTNVVEVHIDGDYTLVRNFLEWQITAKVHPIPGYGWSGGGHLRGLFHKKDEEALDNFFAKHHRPTSETFVARTSA